MVLFTGAWLLDSVLRSKCSQSTGGQENGKSLSQADALSEDARCNKEGDTLLLKHQQADGLHVASCSFGILVKMSMSIR